MAKTGKYLGDSQMQFAITLGSIKWQTILYIEIIQTYYPLISLSRKVAYAYLLFLENEAINHI